MALRHTPVKTNFYGKIFKTELLENPERPLEYETDLKDQVCLITYPAMAKERF